MKKICALLFLLIATCAQAEDIGQYKFYTTDNSRDDQQPKFAAYIKNGDSCIEIKNLTTNKDFRFCQMTKNINLADDPEVYPYGMYFAEHQLNFFVEAYWVPQVCVIGLTLMNLSCELKNGPVDLEESKAEVQKILKEFEVVIPPSVKHVEFQHIKGIRGQFRLIVNNSTINPCFTIEHYTDSYLYVDASPATIKHICSVRVKAGKEDYILPLLGQEVENFTWQNNSLAFEKPAPGGKKDQCQFPLPFTEQTEAVCVR